MDSIWYASLPGGVIRRGGVTSSELFDAMSATPGSELAVQGPTGWCTRSRQKCGRRLNEGVLNGEVNEVTHASDLADRLRAM